MNLMLNKYLHQYEEKNRLDLMILTQPTVYHRVYSLKIITVSKIIKFNSGYLKNLPKEPPAPAIMVKVLSPIE